MFNNISIFIYLYIYFYYKSYYQNVLLVFKMETRIWYNIFITMNKINLTVVAIVATLGVLTAAPAAMNNGAILPQAQVSTMRIIYINKQ